MTSAKVSPSKKRFRCCDIFPPTELIGISNFTAKPRADLTPATQVSDELLSSVGWSIIKLAIRRRIGADRVISLIFLGHPSRVAPFLRPGLIRPAVGGQLAGSGSAQMRWSIAPTRRRVR